MFTDLDGTLLDHDTYDWKPAAGVLAELARRGIPVVLVSSKTMPELENHRRSLNLNEPVIAENGAVIDVPAGYFSHPIRVEDDSLDRSVLQRHFYEIRDAGDYDCVSFEELGDVGIARATGLTAAGAALANRRHASEPIQWRDTEDRLTDFIAEAEARGLRCTRGGRFVHLMGTHDKADAMMALCDAFREKWPDTVIESIALGDGPNDLGMLHAADVAIVIPGRHGVPMPLAGHKQVRVATDPGPTGWAGAMRELLDSWR
ncbi:MAG: HAD-IIB family hydrolase [Woeseiaceae bacterium]|nr:HAD-IIB family hydrolase [Woeseiaceae bacterium]